MKDDEIVAGLLSGEPTAQLEFLACFKDKLPRHLLENFGLSEVDVEIICDQVLWAIIENPSKVNLDKGSIASLVKTWARNRAIDLLRKRTRKGQKRASLAVSLTGLGDDVPDPRSLGHSSNHRSVAEDAPLEVVEEVRLLFGELSKQQARHLELRIRHPSLSPKDIAEFMGISPAAERTRWHRLSRWLKNRVKHYPAITAYGRTLEAEKVDL